MKLIRFAYQNEQSYGVLENETVRTLNGTQNNVVPLADVKLLAPSFPSKIICVGLNYHDHIREMKLPQPVEPLIFLKAPSALNHPGDPIELTPFSNQIELEGELALVIGKLAKNVSEEEALSSLMGYTCFNDVTARDLQRRDSQFCRAKSFDTFACMGPWVETQLDPSNLTIQTYLNGELKQNSNTKEMIFGVPKLVSFVSHMMTLYPGDVISTGSPGGTCTMKSGDVVEVKIEGIGSLRNSVV
ncbi:MAG: fumarylacetoacetate hydrolase family protein [Deltaproteobacteria bacterium]|nr:fumarylacetoacetate hydrolase family protein [Deltaproteobacteria bacterium]